MKCQVDAIQWGGVVAEFFRALKKSRHDSVGGYQNFSVVSKGRRDSVGGGVVAEFLFSVLSKKQRDSVEGG